jgi:hypothetical protein
MSFHRRKNQEAGGLNQVGLPILVMIVGLLGACADRTPPTTASADGTAIGVAPIVAGTALPPGYKIDADRTMVLGSDRNWTGRLSYSTSTDADEVFDFLRREMPSFGWTETTAMRSDVSLLTFVSEATNRVATVHIQRGSLLGSTRVDMVVATRDAPGGRAGVTPARQPMR